MRRNSCSPSCSRLYCSHHDNLGRQSAQTVQYYLLEALTKFIAPVVPHLAEEIYQYHPYNAGLQHAC